MQGPVLQHKQENKGVDRLWEGKGKNLVSQLIGCSPHLMEQPTPRLFPKALVSLSEH